MKETKNSNETTTEALIVDTDYSVLVVEKKDLQAFFLDHEKLDTLYGHVEKMARALVADPLTKEGASQIKSCARQIASVKKRIDDIGKDVVADLKKLPGQIDANRKSLRERLEALQDDIRRPVTEIEERKKAIEDIKGTHFNCANMDSAALVQKIKTMEEEMGALKTEVWKESYDDAVAAYKSEIGALNVMKGAALKREEDARRLAELEANQAEAERIIRENKIKEEARAEGFAQGKAAAVPTAPANAPVRPPIPAPASSPAPSPKAPQAPAQAPIPKTAPAVKHSAWTDEQKAVNNAIVAEIARLIATKLEGFTQNGYELAAREVVKAILKGQINNLKVEY